MNESLNPSLGQAHNREYSKGLALLEGQILVHEAILGPPGWFARRRLRKAIACFERVVRIAPANWPAMWAMGKAYQRLGEHEAALGWFVRGHEIAPDQADVAREGGLTAIESGQSVLAVRLCRAAAENCPDDPGLLANLALALLIDDQMTDADATITRAVEANPDDPISRTVRRLIREVVAGERERPRNGAEIQARLS